ncbi:MAG: hypothetical protein GY711_15525 [bacterium]|nr:hypothetical protein [bacterium]
MRNLLPIALLVCAACHSAPRGVIVPAPAADADPEVRTFTTRDPDSGTVVRRWTVLVHPDGRRERQGVDERWWPDGTQRARRRFEDDRPVGEWRTWHADGTLRSEYRYPVPSGTSTMAFYHPGGAKSAAGPALDGVREGQWTYWYPSGTVRQKGPYEKGRKRGAWVLYHPSGSLEARGRFEDDRRVGKWELWPAEPPVFEDPDC